MAEKKAKVPFYFYTASQLVEITGKKSADLKEFVEILKGIGDSSVFYHVHHAFREHQYAPGVYSNDFAHWIDEEIGESALAEKLSNINIKDFIDVKSLREKIVEIIEYYLSNNPDAGGIKGKHKFYFCKYIGIVQKTKYEAWNLDGFCENLKSVGLRSLFFHFFEARLRLNKKTNDFSDWIKFNFQDEELARRIEALDPYQYTMDELRDKIIALISDKDEHVLKRIFKWLKSKSKITQK